MRVTVTKSPDGVAYMTKDGHGELFADDVKPGAKPVKLGDCTVAVTKDPSLFAEPDALVVLFSYVDYLDTSNREEPGVGVRHTAERSVPGRFDVGPYTIDAQ